MTSTGAGERSLGRENLRHDRAANRERLQARRPTAAEFGQYRKEDILREDPYVSSSDPAEPDNYDYDRHFDDEDYEEYPPVQRRAPGRPTPSSRMPTLTRPTLPSAIANADLVNDAGALGMIGVGLASLAGMAIVVANRADALPPQFASHVSASGVLEDFMGPEGLWRLPLLAAMLTLMNVAAAWFVSPIDRFGSRFLLGGALVVQFVAWIAIVRIL